MQKERHSDCVALSRLTARTPWVRLTDAGTAEILLTVRSGDFPVPSGGVPHCGGAAHFRTRGGQCAGHNSALITVCNQIRNHFCLSSGFPDFCVL